MATQPGTGIAQLRPHNLIEEAQR